MTFEEEDGKIVAMKNQDREQKFLGQKLVFQDTSEPTDIIWENRHWTPRQIMWRAIAAWIVILILMSGSFFFIFWVSSFKAQIARVFPTVDCTNVLANYGHQIDEFAVDDYNFIQEHPGMQSSGCLQCFCEQ